MRNLPPFHMAALPRPDRGAARLVLSAVLAAALALVYVFDLTDYLSFQALAENEAALKALVARMPIIAAALYMAVYVLAVALSIPGAIWLEPCRWPAFRHAARRLADCCVGQLRRGAAVSGGALSGR